MRIAVVAPSSRFDDLDEVVAGVGAIADDYPGLELVFDPQCGSGTAVHFAGKDKEREDALVKVANDAAFDAVWFARGGYGSNRIAEAALARFDPAIAGRKAWLGYSDLGFLLAGLYARGYAGVAHGPMPRDIVRNGGGDAVRRALDWLTARSRAALEPHVRPGTPCAAFNVTVLSMLLGTSLEPRLDGHVLMLEEVDEHLYATDRAISHITRTPSVRQVAGIRLGNVHVKVDPERKPPAPQPFDETAAEIAERWCAEAGIPYLGRAEIGHDSANKVVPFGLL
jgi:muramoyltetrapeptide carboxypeptidase